MKRILLTIAISLLSAATTSAHDFWIEPSTFHPQVGSTIFLRLRVGENYLGDVIPRPPDAKLDRFVAVSARGSERIEGIQGKDPAGFVAIEKPGMILVGYQNKPNFVQLTPDKLDRYYSEEGLEFIRDQRNRLGEASKPWREIFSRCAKSLLWTGNGSTSAWKHRFGMPLEVVPEKNPYVLGANSTLPVQLLYRGKPLKGALVVAIPRSQPKQRLSARSGKDGRVSFKLPRGGEWLIKAVHVVRAPAGAEGDWESFWASLTFDLATSTIKKK